MLNDDAIKAGVLSIRPRYNLTTLPEDIQAINAISRVREGKTLRYIEKCKAVFVTKNTVLVSATKKFLEEQEVDVGFAQVGQERIEETIDPELTIDRALETYLKKGYNTAKNTN